MACAGCILVKNHLDKLDPHEAAIAGGRQPRWPEPWPGLCRETGAEKRLVPRGKLWETLIAQGIAAILLVTIGVTNFDVTSHSDVDDGVADQGMDCT
ncbi:hypothetical protein D3C76_1055320 [compost metagenome]